MWWISCWFTCHFPIQTTCSPVVDLFVDLRDGHRLLTLLEVLTNERLKREKGRMRVHHINNINTALNVLQRSGVKLVNISSDDIVAGSAKLTLGLIWAIALSFDGQKLVNSQGVSGIEKSLMLWARKYTEPHGLKIGDFSSSWSDGRAFLYILHEHVPKFDLERSIRQHPMARLVSFSFIFLFFLERSLWRSLAVFFSRWKLRITKGVVILEKYENCKDENIESRNLYQ